jgi:hypothetical protein
MAIVFYNGKGEPKPRKEDLEGKLLLVDNGMVYPGFSALGRAVKVSASRLTARRFPRAWDEGATTHRVLDWADVAEGTPAWERGEEERVVALTSVRAACDTVAEVNLLVDRSHEAERRYRAAVDGLARYLREGDKETA